MENLISYYINEAKEGIDIDGVIVPLLNKAQAKAIFTKNGISNQVFEKIIKMTTDYYSAHIAGKKASDFIPDAEIKAKFPDLKYIQDITIRSYLCYVLESDKMEFDNLLSDDETAKKQATHDITLNMAIVQLKKIYKINSLKFTKIFKKESEGITRSEVKSAVIEIEKQIKFDTVYAIPDGIKDLVIKNNEPITNLDVKNIKNEIKKVDSIVIDDPAIKNVNKYLTAIRETFDFLKSHFKGITIKNLEKNQKIIEEADKNNDSVFINKIQEILRSLGHINTYAMKENFESMNVIAWCSNVLNLKAYHTGADDFSPIDNDLEKKVVSILSRYKPAQRNSYDAYHLVEDFIEICRDQTGEIKISHEITDLMLTQIVKDFMIKANDQVNTLLTVSNKMNKTKNIEVKKDEAGKVIQIVNNQTEKQRLADVKKMISELSKNVNQARKFFFDLYGGLTTFNNTRWESLDTKTQNEILKAAKLNRNSAEFLERKLSKKIENITGTNPISRDAQEMEKLKQETMDMISKNMSENAKDFIRKFNNLSHDKVEAFKGHYGSKYQLAEQIIKRYETTGKINKVVKDIFDSNSKNKLAEIIRIIPPNGSIRHLLEESVAETPLLNKYIGMINENY